MQLPLRMFQLMEDEKRNLWKRYSGKMSGGFVTWGGEDCFFSYIKSEKI